ncbi:tectonic-3-like [Brachionichthys hirsutus]|uniref:tectonic-3-like n=1 Tax=Brachionichthys hirsutus TaxID=412623 RepID=UPI003604A348
MRIWMRGWRLVQIFVVLCGRLTNAATESGATSAANVSPTDGELLRSVTPPPGGTAAVETASVGADEAVTLDATTHVGSDGPTEAPFATTAQTVVTSGGCLCDLTPDFCDIGCCCDTVDCGIANLSTVFARCPQKSPSGVCIEKWLLFGANVDLSLVTITDSMFCIRTEENKPRSLPALSPHPPLGDSYHFSPLAPTSSSYSRHFYRVDDVIQTYFPSSSVHGLLRQPSPGTASAFCTNRNPARFLRSVSQSCTRMLTRRSCSTDPTLNAHSYFSDLSLSKIPVAEMTRVSDFMIPVTPLSDWPAPREQNDSCVNVVKEVEFVIGYTGKGELTNATVNIVLVDAAPDQLLLQTHSVQFQIATAKPTPGLPIPAVGLRTGSPIVGRFDEGVEPVSTLGVSQNGECSPVPGSRTPVLFKHNAITGCMFSPPSANCSELRAQIYRVLQGIGVPDVIAMNSGSQPDWTRVITHKCPVNLEETRETGCVLPNSASIQILWARQGLLDHPQSYILGAKYIFKCQHFEYPVSSPIALTTEVTFADTTVYPEPPWGSPRPNWKFPFGFFTRGAAELDGHVVINGSGTKKVTWSLMLFTLMLITRLEFFQVDP